MGIKVWTKEEIKDRIKTSDTWLFRALVALYNRQTGEEQEIRQTKMDNKAGFSAFDAEFLTSVAQQFLEGKILSPKQIAITRNKLLKYSGQLAKLANGKEERKVEHEKAVDRADHPVVSAGLCQQESPRSDGRYSS